jgi:phage tail-like protein
MPAVRFVHLRSVDAWLRCDHQNTALHPQTATVRLGGQRDDEPGRVDAPRFAAWVEARAGVVNVPAAVDRIDPLTRDTSGKSARYVPARGGVLVADRRGLWTPGERGWDRVAPPPKGSGDPLRFGPPAAAPEPTAVAGTAKTLARDRLGRLWALQDDGMRIRVVDERDLRALFEIAAPAGARLDHLDTTDRGVVGIDGRQGAVWWRPHDGEWALVDLVGPFGEALSPEADAIVKRLADRYTPIAVAGGPGDRVAVLYRSTAAEGTHAPDRSRTASCWLESHAVEPDASAVILLLEGRRARIVEVPDARDPLHLVALPDGSWLIGEAQADAPPAQKSSFTRFVLDGERLTAEDGWLARSFDGRGLLVDAAGRAWATTPGGLRPLFRSQRGLRSSGQIETLALDSGAAGTQWHRLFLDACLPAGTSVQVWARAAEAPYEIAGDVRPRPPPHFAPSGDKKSFGSRTPDDVEGWVRLDVLDRRPPWVDAVLPFRGERPSDDPYTRHVGPRAELRFDTYEGLLRVPPGRYLWLRIELFGTRRSTPIIVGLRATFPRPSLLGFLPAFWRIDPESARRMDEVLSLFEGVFTELNDRVSALPLLFDPRLCPPEMLAWLGSVVGIGIDTRVREAQRRQLVLEAFALYRGRGTVPGLERLLSILTDSRVRVVEAFRTRPALAGGASSPPRWEAELAAAHRELVARYRSDELDAWLREQGQPPPEGAAPRPNPCCEDEPRRCPTREPPCPLDPDPVVAHFRRHANGFSVLIPCRCEPELAAVVDRAIEAWKPAHTVHEVHWTGGGLTLGPMSYLGLWALGPGDPGPAVLGRPPTLGTVLGRAVTHSSTPSHTRFRAASRADDAPADPP